MNASPSLTLVDLSVFGDELIPAPHEAQKTPHKPVSSKAIFAIDPGPTQSGWVVYDSGRVVEGGVMLNEEMLTYLECQTRLCKLAIEMIASYGMAVGKEVFETCVWIGRFQQAWHAPEKVQKVYRRDVKLHLCGTSKAKDANIRQALIDLYPATGGGKCPQIGTKGQPGPLYGVSTHVWPALAVAVTLEASHV